MEDVQAFRIVSALAGGTHPVTGEIFPPDSPYQSPDVIRALYSAASALKSRIDYLARQAGRSPSDKPSQSSTYANPAVGNAGKTWSSEEDERLLSAFDSGKTLTELAQAHGRTQGGVRARLEKHGRLEPSPATRWPTNRSQGGSAQSAAR